MFRPLSAGIRHAARKICVFIQVKSSIVQLYNAETMEFIQTAATTQFAVRSLSFAPTGDRLAAAGDDPGLLIVSVDINDESSVKHTINVGPNTRCVAWDPAGTYVALAQTNGTIQIWDASTQEEVWKDRCAPAVRLLEQTTTTTCPCLDHEGQGHQSTRPSHVGSLPGGHSSLSRHHKSRHFHHQMFCNVLRAPASQQSCQIEWTCPVQFVMHTTQMAFRCLWMPHRVCTSPGTHSTGEHC